MSILPDLRFICLLAFLASASYYDCRWQRIPNWLNFIGFATGLGLALAGLAAPEQEEANTVGGLFLGMLIALTATFLFYLGGGMGGGDVKMAPGFGLLCGYPDVINYLFYGCLAGLAMLLGRLAWHGEIIQELGRMLRRKPRIIDPGAAQDAARNDKQAGSFISFALALAAGVCWVWCMRHI